jgi:hypothetical protein
MFGGIAALSRRAAGPRHGSATANSHFLSAQRAPTLLALKFKCFSTLPPQVLFSFVFCHAKGLLESKYFVSEMIRSSQQRLNPSGSVFGMRLQPRKAMFVLSYLFQCCHHFTSVGSVIR